MFSHPVYLFLRKFSLQDSRGGSTRIGANIVSRLRGRRWTRAEVSLFGKFSAEEIAIATCRSIYSVRAMRYKLKKLDEERTGIQIN
ncbi:hypothetical protein [Escherichia coli]|uniref:hypothetical protein n=1 Tax=Escherichia coli TaxID=562 RepID=UPI0033149481